MSPDGSTLYVTNPNAGDVWAIRAATGLPGSVAVTPDGSQVWIGNNLSGNISVINPATNAVTSTISGGAGTATLDAAPLAIAFTKATTR